MRIWDAAESGGACPVTVAQGREWLHGYAQSHPLRPLDEEAVPEAGKTAVNLQNICFRYEKNAPDVLRHLSLQVRYGEILTIMGGNGTGKSTLLSVLNGTRKPYSGKVISDNELCLLLPQNPQALFSGSTVWETLWDLPALGGLPEEERSARVQSVIRLCQIGELTARHPFDLSGGEMQKVALAKLLMLRPRVLLLDEPSAMTWNFVRVTVIVVCSCLTASWQQAARPAHFSVPTASTLLPPRAWQESCFPRRSRRRM